MTATDIARRPHAPSIDDYLGPAEGRFFGHGYRRVHYDLADGVTVDGGGVHARVGVSYPADWSRKAGAADRVPHLSTLDALILGARFAETALHTAYGLDAAQTRRAWLRRVDIRAGNTPYERGLDAVAVAARVAGTEPAPCSLCGHRSTVDVRVGNMTLRCEIEHEAVHGRPPAQRDGGGDGSGARLYGDGFRDRSAEIADLAIAGVESRARAAVTLASYAAARGACGPGRMARPADGLEAHYQPSLSMIESFVVSLQLGQVLLYELDGVARADSNTLWMRHTTIEATTPFRPAVAPVAATVSLQDSRRLTARGGTWRTATIVGHSPGLRTRCAVAHELPATVERQAA
jgi:hypothetical protein